MPAPAHDGGMPTAARVTRSREFGHFLEEHRLHRLQSQREEPMLPGHRGWRGESAIIQRRRLLHYGLDLTPAI